MLPQGAVLNVIAFNAGPLMSSTMENISILAVQQCRTLKNYQQIILGYYLSVLVQNTHLAGDAQNYTFNLC